MDIAQFQLRSLIFELRYDPAFLLWDNAGTLWYSMRDKWPELKTSEAAPSSVKGRVRNTEIVVQLERLHVSCAARKIDVDVFNDYCTSIISLVRNQLDVHALLRVGLRQIYIRRYKTEDDAIDGFYSTGILKPLTGKSFGISGQPKAPECVLRGEGESLGWMAHLLVQTKKIQIDVPTDEDLPKIDETFFELAFDFDYFTTTEVTVEQIRAADWIKQAMHVCRRDSKLILGG